MAEPDSEAKRLRDEATALYQEQRDARGWDEITGDQRRKIVQLLGLPKDHPVLRIKPYHASPEGEARARKIVALRRQAAAAEDW